MNDLPQWPAPDKPAELTYHRLIEAILSGAFPADSTLPAERQLSDMLGVTRSTLRETLQRLAADGWIEIQQGKPTRVCDVWTEGNLNTLAHLVRHHGALPASFVPHLLEVRAALAPLYAQEAVSRSAAAVVDALDTLAADLPDTPESFANADWLLHHRLTVLSGNPVYTLILNGFEGFYDQMAVIYFRSPQARAYSRVFYADLRAAASAGEAGKARRIVSRVMKKSLDLWQLSST